MFYKLLLSLAALIALPLCPQVHAQQSVSLSITPPSSIRVNQQVRFTATLANAWTAEPLAGRLVYCYAGPRYSLSNFGYRNSSNSGQVSFACTFSQVGKQRVVVSVDDKYGYLGTRTTIFVNVTP